MVVRGQDTRVRVWLDEVLTGGEGGWRADTLRVGERLEGRHTYGVGSWRDESGVTLAGWGHTRRLG